MQAIKLTIDDAHRIHRREADRCGPQRTKFILEEGGRTHYEVSVPGWPPLESGLEATAFLRKTGNWQTVQGWMDHRSRRLFEASRWSYGNTALAAFLFLLGCVFSLGEAKLPASGNKVVYGITCIFGLLFLQHLHVSLQRWRALREMRSALENLPP